MSKKARVVLVGRMNVGKSTLFNRLSSQVKSLTLDFAGVTRDVLKDTVVWQGREFELIDTGGVQFRKTDNPIQKAVEERVQKFITEADIVLFVVDGTAGVTAIDQEINDLLRKQNKKVFLVVNKSDTKAAEGLLSEFYALNHEQLFFISAQHAQGIGELLEAVVQALPEAKLAEEKEQPAYRITLLGRPNVGKSSLMNALLQEERSIVSSIPGTTREAVAERIAFYQEHLEIVDTPGIRRSRAIEEDIEQLMVKSAFRALRESDIVLLMIDASEATIVDQELKLAFYAFTEMHKALIILINKSDLLDEKKQAELTESLEPYKHLMDKVEKLTISCKTGKNIGRILPLVKKVWERHSQRLPADELKRVLLQALGRVPLMRNRQRLEVYKVSQVSTAPITIKLKTNLPQFFETSQQSFFENIVRRTYNLKGVPVRFVIW